MSDVEASNPVDATGGSVLVVNDREGIADWLRQRHPDWHVSSSESYLSGIAELAGGRFRTVMAYVEPWQQDVAKAVAGLREAAGDDAKVLLCCRTEAEPVVLRAVHSGADDYLICPLREEEVREVLADGRLAEADSSPSQSPTPAFGRDGAPRPDGASPDEAPLPDAASEAAGETVSQEAAPAELAALGEVLDRLGSSPEKFLDSAADYLRAAMQSRAARVVVEGSMGCAGDTASEPQLVEPLYRESQSIGHAAVWPKAHGSYAESDLARLKHYGKVIGRLAVAALQRRRLDEMAYTDELSGLPNRRRMHECLQRLIQQARQDGSTVTLLMFDIDDFKSYNDAHGHAAGDEIIKGCGELFRRNVREHDVVTRYGGDEFAVIFWDKEEPRIAGSQHPRELLPLIHRFRRSLRAHRFERIKLPKRARLTISGGLASFPHDASTADDLIAQADAALLAAKREGKNRIHLCGENGGRKPT